MRPDAASPRARIVAGGLAVAVLGLLATSAAVALAGRIGAGPDDSSCPHGRSSADGCAAAPRGASFIIPDLPGRARQSGQRSLLASHPMPFNVPAWDYAIGYARTATLRDPRRDALPEGCVFQPHGAPLSGGPLVDCVAPAATRGPLLIERWNFFRDGDCIRLRIQPSVRESVIIRDNNFRNGPTCYVANGDLIDVAGGAFALEISSNTFDGDHPGVRTTALAATARGWHAIHDFRRNLGAGVAPGVFRYNVFLRNPGRALSSFSDGEIDFSFNFVEDMGLAYAVNGEHVEVAAINNPKPTTLGRWSYINNLVLEGSGGIDHAGAATFYVSNGFDDGSVIDSVQIRNNVVVVNRTASGTAFTGAALFSTGHNRYKAGVPPLTSRYAIEATGNYVDASGAYACALNSPYARQVTGSISGNILTIDSIGAGTKVFPAGAALSGPGIKSAIIQGFEPGGGGGGARITGRIDRVGPAAVLTVTAVQQGVVMVGSPISGPGVPGGAIVTRALPGARGELGRYEVSAAQPTPQGQFILAGVGRYRLDGSPQTARGVNWSISPDVRVYWGSAATGDANRSLRDNSVVRGFSGGADSNAQCAGHFEGG